MKAGLTPTKFIILILLLTRSVSAQIPINGFCNFNEFELKPGYSNFLAVDFNVDGYRDIIAYNQQDKKYTALTYDSRKKTFTSADYYAPFGLNTFHSFSENEKDGRKFVYASRKERSAGIVTISRRGTFSVDKKIKYDSYPSNIDVGDINRNRNPEILISGSGFEGIDVLKVVSNRFVADKIVEEGIFSYSGFIDLDYDNFLDIAAYNTIASTLTFFYNDQTGGFTHHRTIPIGFDISEFQIADVNSDGYTDLAYIKNKQIEILLGDSVSTFKKTLSIISPNGIDKFSVFDFNADGYNDVAFISKEQGELYISFAKNSSTFHSPILYLKRKGIIDLKSYVDRGGRKLIVLDQTGKIYLIDKLTGYDNSFAIAAGAQPSLLAAFDYLNDKKDDLVVFDEENWNLNFYASSKNNLFDQYFSFNFSQNHRSVKVENLSPSSKIVYGFSQGERTVEVVQVNFDRNSFERRILYADGPIVDLKFSDDKGASFGSIYLLIKKKGRLYLQTFDFRDFRFKISGLDSIAANVGSAVISLNKYKEIFYFSEYKNTLYLNKTIFGSKWEKVENVSSTSISNDFERSIFIKNFQRNDGKENPIFTSFTSGSDTRISIIKKGNHYSFPLPDFVPAQEHVFNVDKSNGSDFYLLDNSRGTLKRIAFRENFNSYKINDVFESQTINNYIVAQINKRKDYLIYSDKSSNVIKFNSLE